MKKSVFEYVDYRSLLFDSLAAKDKRGQLSKAAAFLGCQSSFLSRVINEELHLTPEHAFKLCQFWMFRPEERNYFQKLVDFERAGDKDYKNFLRQQLEDLKNSYNQISVRTGRQNKKVDVLNSQYFSSWIYSAIHFITCVPAFQTPRAISKKLNISEELVGKILQELCDMGFLIQKADRWIYKAGDFHLERNSPLVNFHHQNWRQKALIDSQQMSEEHIHYTTVLTLSRQDIAKIHSLILDHISELNQVAEPSSPEDIAIFTCDFFKI